MTNSEFICSDFDDTLGTQNDYIPTMEGYAQIWIGAPANERWSVDVADKVCGASQRLALGVRNCLESQSGSVCLLNQSLLCTQGGNLVLGHWKVSGPTGSSPPVTMRA